MSTCTQCGGAVLWKQEAGRWLCLNMDGITDHWDECAKQRWQQVKTTGERFEGKQFRDRTVRSGYAGSVHGTKFDRIAVKSVRGANYRPFTHGPACNGAPPWEDCGCSAFSPAAYQSDQEPAK